MSSPVSVPSLRPVTGAAREVAVWWMGIDVDEEQLAAAERSVDLATRERAARMHRADDARRTLLAHALVRQVLWRHTGTAPADLVLPRRCAACGGTDHGRPYLPGGPSFGLSHGGRIVAVAVAAEEASAAIDVEADQPPARWEAVRRHAFTDADWAATRADPGPARTALWARKEAVVKAMGLGLELALTRLHLPAAGRSLAAVRVDDGDPSSPPGPWSVADVPLAAGHQAAVALRGRPEDWRVRPPQRLALVDPT